MKSFKEFLAEAMVIKASGNDRAKGESYTVYDTTTNKVVVDSKNQRYTGLKRSSAKELADNNPKWKVASDSWAADNGIK